MSRTFDLFKLTMERYQDTTYTEASFPMVYKDGRIGFTANGEPVLWSGMSNDGRTYILYRLGQYVDRKHARTLSNQAFVKYVNQQRKWQESEELYRRDEKLIVAVNRDVIDGLLTNYRPVTHREVLEMIDQSSVSNLITDYSLSPKEMVLFFRSRYFDSLGIRAEFGLAVRNGETGHVTLGYHLYVTNNDYVFFVPLNVKRRHLSKIEEARGGLEQMLQIAGEIEVDKVLENTPASVFLPLLSEQTYGKLLEKLNGGWTGDTLVDVLFRLRDGERGLKTLATRALDIVFDKAFELAND